MTVTQERHEIFVGGRWEAPCGGSVVEVVSPHTEEPIGCAPMATESDVERAVAAARRAFDEGPWPRLDVAERVAALRRFADRYLANHEDMAAVVTAEMGTPISFSRVGQSWAAWALLDTTLALAAEFPWEEVRTSRFGYPTVVRREPAGVVAAITPWNVPQITIMSKLAPALAAGCTAVVKPAEESPLDALLMAEWLADADLPEGVVSVLPAGREVGEHLVRHPGVDKVAFTGSTAAGRRIGAICGGQVKRVSLELGGKSAAVVLDDADLGTLTSGLRFASFVNSGQACAAQTRVLAPRSRYAEVVDALAEVADSLAVGDPAEASTEVGPMVARRQQERVDAYIRLGVDEGATPAAGGPGRPAGITRGWYVRPTVFSGVDNGMRIAREEIFGPVLVVIPYDGEEEAVRLANDSEYGLAGSVWTADPERGLSVARRIRAGTLGVNKYAPDFTAPFGGFKASGIGREYGPEGLAEYVELKSVVP